MTIPSATGHRPDKEDSDFKLVEHAVPIPLPPDVELPLHKRMNAAYAVMHADMTRSLYGNDSVPFTPRKRRIRDFLDRAHNAWLVLTGRADIC